MIEFAEDLKADRIGSLLYTAKRRLGLSKMQQQLNQLDPMLVIIGATFHKQTRNLQGHFFFTEAYRQGAKTIELVGGSVAEFSVCPRVLERPKLSHHIWFVEFIKRPSNLNLFTKTLNEELENQNIYYKDLIVSSVIGPLKIFCVKKGGFNEYMKSIGKFGGQNKCPHLLNDTKIGDFLTNGYVY